MTRQMEEQIDDNNSLVICGRLLRHLEVKAYAEVVSALRAQGGLSETKLQLLDQLRAILLISAERHKAEIRRATNDEKLSTIARSLNPGRDVNAEWLEEGRRENPLTPQIEVGLRRNEDVSSDVVEMAQKINVDNARIAELAREAEAVKVVVNQPKKRGRKRKGETIALESNKMKNLGRVDHPGLAIANQKLLEGSTSDDFKIGGQESRSQTKVKSKPKAVKQRLFVRTKKFGDLGPLKARSYKTTASGHKMTRRGGSSGRPRLDLKGLISHMKEQSGAVAPPNVSMDDQSDCGPVSPKKQSVMSAAEVRINQLYVKNGKLKRGRPRKYPVQGLLQSPSGVSRSGRKLNPTPKMTSSQENFSDSDGSSESEFLGSPKFGNGAEFISNEEFYARSRSEADKLSHMKVEESPTLTPTTSFKQSATIRDIVDSVAKLASQNSSTNVGGGEKAPKITRTYLPIRSDESPVIPKRSSQTHSYSVVDQHQFLGYSSMKNSPQVHKVFSSVSPSQSVPLPTKTTPLKFTPIVATSSADAAAMRPPSPFKSGLTLLAECVKKSTSFGPASTTVASANPARRVITAYTMGNNSQKPGVTPSQAFIVLSANGNRIHQNPSAKVISVTENTVSSGGADKLDPQKPHQPVIIVQNPHQQQQHP